MRPPYCGSALDALLGSLKIGGLQYLPFEGLERLCEGIRSFFCGRAGSVPSRSVLDDLVLEDGSRDESCFACQKSDDSRKKRLTVPLRRMLGYLSDELWKLGPVSIDTGSVQEVDVPLGLVIAALKSVSCRFPGAYWAAQTLILDKRRGDLRQPPHLYHIHFFTTSRLCLALQ